MTHHFKGFFTKYPQFASKRSTQAKITNNVTSKTTLLKTQTI